MSSTTAPTGNAATIDCGNGFNTTYDDSEPLRRLANIDALEIVTFTNGVGRLDARPSVYRRCAQRLLSPQLTLAHRGKYSAIVLSPNIRYATG